MKYPIAEIVQFLFLGVPIDHPMIFCFRHFLLTKLYTTFDFRAKKKKMNPNPWQVDSIDAFYCLKCPECMFFSWKEFDFKHHALENHPMSNFLFGKSTQSTYLMEPAMIKKEPCEVEIKDNSDLKLIEVKSESFDTTRNLNENNTIVGIKMLDNFETLDRIKSENNSGTIFAENLGIKEEYSEESNDLNNSNQMPNKNKLQKCKICEKNFSELPRHMAIAHHACILCDKTFTSNQNLNNHIASVHEKLKPHRCDLCNASFASKSHLMIRHRYSRTCVKQQKKNFQELG